MIRVGFYYGFPGGGIGRYNLECLRSLAREPGLDLRFLCLPEFPWDESIECGRWAGLQRVSSPSPMVQRSRFLAGQVVNPRRALRHVQSIEAHILHCSSLDHLGFPIWRRILDRSKVAFVATAHDVRRQVSLLNRRYEDSQLAAIYQRADAILVHTEAQVRELAEFANVGRDRVHIVPHGPFSYGQPTKDRRHVREHYGFGPDEVVGLFFGQLRDEKNLACLLEALAEGRSSSRLLVAGTSGRHHLGAAEYEAMAKRLGLEQRVVFDSRHVPDGEVADLFNASDWVALPYASSFTGQSGVLNLAVHYQRPVLAGAAPGIAEAARRYPIGVACESDTPSSLATALAELEGKLEDQADGLFCFERYRSQNNWEQNARATAEVYRSLCAEGAAGWQ